MENVTKYWPWKVSLFLLFATMISYLDRQAFSFAGPILQEELHIDNGELGMLFSAFFLAYGIMHFFIGWFLDRFNIRIVYAVFVSLWSLAQMATGLPKTFAGLLSCRFSLGIFNVQSGNSIEIKIYNIPEDDSPKYLIDHFIITK